MKSSFEVEVAAARPRVTAVIARLVGDDAEDVVQEAILRAFLSLSQLRDPERFEAWLCGIALNLAKMRLRRAATEARVLAVAGPQRAAPDREPLEAVRDAVSLLPPAQRDAVLLYYVDGLSCDEIAAALGTSPGAVRVRLHRARAELRRSLAPYAAAPSTRKERPMIEMELYDVIVRVGHDDRQKIVWDQRGIVLRERDGGRLLSIWTGSAEGDALVFNLYQAHGHRPLTADLMAELVRALGGGVEQVAITRLEDHVFYAAVVAGGREVDARPSDAINLAARLGVPIVVAAAVLDEAGRHGDATLVFADCEDAPAGEWRSLSMEMLASAR